MVPWRRHGPGVLAAAALLVATARSAAAPQSAEGVSPNEYRAEMEQADRQIDAEVRAHSQLVSNLEYLTTHIGARLTGTQAYDDAAAWSLQQFRGYGLSAHVETMTIAHAWYRGDDTAAVIAPIERRIDVRSLGWSKATGHEVTAPVVALENTSAATIAANRSRLAGAIVLVGTPRLTSPPNPANAYDAVVPLPRGVPVETVPTGVTPDLVNAGPAVILRDSGKADNLFSMGSAGPGFEESALPTALVTHEDYSLLHRLAQSGPVSMKVNLRGTFGAGEQPVPLVVAEIRGTLQPEQRVILGAHLDSWDLGQGALDNGTGAMAVLEAARTLTALGLRPERTLTFILFPGEEQGLRGSQWYVQQHAGDLASIDAMLVHDTGTGRVFSIALEGFYETAPLLSRVYQPLQEVYDLEPLTARTFTGSDHVPFMQAGVPAYFCVQRPAHYGEAHHSQTDTFDKVLPDEVNQGAAVLASWAWNVSQLTESLPRRQSTTSPR